MTDINLLPWREEQRQTQKQRFLLTLGTVAILSVLLISGIHLTISHSITKQKKLNTIIQHEITLLNNHTRQTHTLKQQMLTLSTRMEAITALQTTRPQIVHLLEELMTLLPNTIQLTRVTRKDNLITLHGLSNANHSISQLIRNIKRSPWLTQPTLHILKTQPAQHKQHTHEFVLNLVLTQENTHSDNPS